MITLEGWTQVLYMTSRAAGALAGVYCISLVCFGSMYLLNLFLAVMWHVYTSQPVEGASLDGVWSETNASRAAPSCCGGGADNVEGSLCHSQGVLAAPHAAPHDPQAVGAARRRDASTPPPPTAKAAACDCAARLVGSRVFHGLTVSLIVLTVLLLMCEHHPMDPQLLALLEHANVVISLLFALEMGLKHLSYGVGGYWADAFNCFDGVVVLFALVEIASGFVEAGIHGQVLRAFRLLRVFKLLRSWTNLQRLIAALLSSAQQFFYLMLLLALLLFIFALLGMQVRLRRRSRGVRGWSGGDAQRALARPGLEPPPH